MSKGKEAGGWNQIYAKPEGYEYYNLFGVHPDLERLADIFKENEVKSVLDIGCGTGSNLMFLARSGFQVSGIDESEQSILLSSKRVKEEGLSASLTQSRFQELPFESGQFDAVISVQTLNHGYEKDVRQGIAEIERVLVPNGLLFLTVPGRVAKGETRYCLVKTARKVADRVYIPTKGQEIGVPHYIYNKNLLRQHLSNFQPNEDIWHDDKDYYCFLGTKI